MLISVINHTNGLIPDADVQTAIRAINRQITEDFFPHWSMGATLRLEGNADPGRRTLPDLSIETPIEMRGDAVIYLWHPMNIHGALGFHSRNFMGIPYGFVFPSASAALNEPWTVTLSHEALEMIADPDVNLLVMGPHPADRSRGVFHWYEMCDAVQSTTYQIDGVPVSNFVLPLYFTSSNEIASRNDFLGALTSTGQLTSFGVIAGGYVGFFNPGSRGHETFFLEGDTVAFRRYQFKRTLELTRRSRRYDAPVHQYEPQTERLRRYLANS